MEKSLKLFDKWRLEQPTQRRALYVHSSHQFNHESILYLICCWDYVYNPDDRKIQGLVDVFIQANSPGSINIRGSQRKGALKLLGNPTPKASFEGTNARAPMTLLHEGGARQGGAANYNLMTQAIELTLPVCMAQVEDSVRGAEAQLSNLVKGGDGGKAPTAAAVQLVTKHLTQYWGPRVIELGLN